MNYKVHQRREIQTRRRKNIVANNAPRHGYLTLPYRTLPQLTLLYIPTIHVRNHFPQNIFSHTNMRQNSYRAIKDKW